MTTEKAYDKITTVINNLCNVSKGEILPAKKIVNREEIINAAVEIVSESGIGALKMPKSLKNRRQLKRLKFLTIICKKKSPKENFLSIKLWVWVIFVLPRKRKNFLNSL